MLLEDLTNEQISHKTRLTNQQDVDPLLTIGYSNQLRKLARTAKLRLAIGMVKAILPVTLAVSKLGLPE